MDNVLPLPPNDDLDTQMLKVARSIAQGIYELEDILKYHSVEVGEFTKWKNNPRFQKYLQEEIEQWNSASNAAERTKLKAAAVVEQFMIEAHSALHDRKQALNHRVELLKVVARLGGMGEVKQLAGAGGGGFSLQINITNNGKKEQVTIQPDFGKVIEHDGTDDFDPFTSPSTLGDL